MIIKVPLPDIFCVLLLQNCCSLSLSWETDFTTSSKSRWELTVKPSVDPERETDDILYRHKDKTQTTCISRCLIKSSVFEKISVTWRKWTWSCVCERFFSSASLLLRSSISCFSRSSRSSARLTAVFSWSLICCVASERLLSMERMSSVKILSLSSTAVCAERC